MLWDGNWNCYLGVSCNVYSVMTDSVTANSFSYPHIKEKT